MALRFKDNNVERVVPEAIEVRDFVNKQIDKIPTGSSLTPIQEQRINNSVQQTTDSGTANTAIYARNNAVETTLLTPTGTTNTQNHTTAGHIVRRITGGHLLVPDRTNINAEIGLDTNRALSRVSADRRYVQLTDARLTNRRDPLPHSHGPSEIHANLLQAGANISIHRSAGGVFTISGAGGGGGDGFELADLTLQVNKIRDALVQFGLSYGMNYGSWEAWSNLLGLAPLMSPVELFLPSTLLRESAKGKGVITIKASVITVENHIDGEGNIAVEAGTSFNCQHTFWFKKNNELNEKDNVGIFTVSDDRYCNGMLEYSLEKGGLKLTALNCIITGGKVA